jgi:uncharacterized protein YndB with AHSA1/START domain
MGYLVRALKFLVALVLTAAVVLWFAARRGDRGYIQEEVTIDRSAPVLFRWIVSDELLRRWISDVSKLERSGTAKGPAQASSDFRLEELIANQPVAFEIKIVRTIPNQEIDLLVQPPPPEPMESYISNANFKLFPDGDYTRLVFTSQTNYFSLSDRIFEPILTYATRRKLRDDLARLKVMVEAEAPPENRRGTRGQ